jgi:hypothetical protein
MLVDGKTGQERLCKNYDEPKHRCRVWDGASPRVVSHHRKVAAVTSAASPAPSVEPKKEDTK